jgi:hypothetical protein
VAEGGTLGIAGGVNILGLTNAAERGSGRGPMNQRLAALPPGDGVRVLANARAESIHIAGAGVPPINSSGGAGGFGGYLNQIDVSNTAMAWIDDRALVRAARDVEVRADCFNFLAALTLAGAKAEKIGIDGSVAILQLAYRALAFVENEAVLDAGGDVIVFADDICSSTSAGRSGSAPPERQDLGRRRRHHTDPRVHRREQATTPPTRPERARSTPGTTSNRARSDLSSTRSRSRAAAVARQAEQDQRLDRRKTFGIGFSATWPSTS